MKFYHATALKNMSSITDDGVIHKGIDGCVYLTTDPLDALKFIYIRGIKEIAVFEVELKKKLVKESFDHSQRFFQCNAYYYEGDIHNITGLSTYDLNDLESRDQ